jgi:hypothetical protein
MTPACDECHSKRTCMSRLLVAGQGRGSESHGWRFCPGRAADDRSLKVFRLILGSNGAVLIWQWYPECLRSQVLERAKLSFGKPCFYSLTCILMLSRLPSRETASQASAPINEQIARAVVAQPLLAHLSHNHYPDVL